MYKLEAQQKSSALRGRVEGLVDGLDILTPKSIDVRGFYEKHKFPVVFAALGILALFELGKGTWRLGATREIEEDKPTRRMGVLAFLATPVLLVILASVSPQGNVIEATKLDLVCPPGSVQEPVLYEVPMDARKQVLQVAAARLGTTTQEMLTRNGVHSVDELVVPGKQVQMIRRIGCYEVVQ